MKTPKDLNADEQKEVNGGYAYPPTQDPNDTANADMNGTGADNSFGNQPGMPANPRDPEYGNYTTSPISSSDPSNIA